MRGADKLSSARGSEALPVCMRWPACRAAMYSAGGGSSRLVSSGSTRRGSACLQLPATVLEPRVGFPSLLHASRALQAAPASQIYREVVGTVDARSADKRNGEYRIGESIVLDLALPAACTWLPGCKLPMQGGFAA